MIHTGHPSDVPVELHVRGQRRFLGTLGQSRRYVGSPHLQHVCKRSAPKALPKSRAEGWYNRWIRTKSTA